MRQLLTSFAFAVSTLFVLSGSSLRAADKIDRHAVVSRHDVVYTQPELKAPLTVGHGKFDLRKDPKDNHNVAANPEYKNQLTQTPRVLKGYEEAAAQAKVAKPLPRKKPADTAVDPAA